MMSAFLAMDVLVALSECSELWVFLIAVPPEREAEGVEQSPTLRVIAGRGDDRDIHPPGRVDLVVVDLREDELLGDAEGVVPPSVESLWRKTSKVADTGDRQGDEPVEELPHAITAHGDLGTDGIAFAQLEAGDGFLGPGHERLLTGDGGQITDRAFEQGGL